MIVKLLTEHHLEFLSLEVDCTGSSESTLVKMSNCWKSRAATHIQSPLAISNIITLFIFKITVKSKKFVFFLPQNFEKIKRLAKSLRRLLI